MYKLLLVDDERIIREGIVQLVDWASLKIDVEEATNGVEAYNKIKEAVPDIVITDIKMPGMDGLELIEKVKAEFPDVVFVILSGYGEFNFATRAMQHGIKYYLLKPCDEEEITKVLKKVIDEINQKKQKEDFIKNIEENLNRVMPQVKEQFLRDCVMGRLNNEDLDYFKDLLELPAEKMRLLLFHLEGSYNFEKRFALKSLLDYNKRDDYLLSTLIEENILVLQKVIPFDSLFNYLEEIKEEFYGYYGIQFTVAISSDGFFEQLPALYSEAKEYLEYRFYLGEGSIITKNDVVEDDENISGLAASFDYQRLGLLIRSGNVNAVQKEIEKFFSKLKSYKLKIDVVRTLCIELYISVIRQGNPENLNEYMKRIPELQEIDTINKMFDFINSTAKEIAEANYKKTVQKNNRIIQKVLKVIEDNIDDEELSLSKIADKIVYMNVDYLGKLFKKEVGENFSQYLINARIERAKKLLSQDHYSKISDIAHKVGYGNNPQYFGQVFKKITGYTPSEYRKILKS